MRSRGKVSGTAVSIPVGIGIGLAVSVIITLLGAAVAAYMIASEAIGESNIGYASMITLVAATVAGAATAVAKTKRLRLQISLLTGSAYFLTLLATTALFFGGQFDGVTTTLILIMIGSLLVTLIPQKKNEWRRHAGKRYR